MDLADAVNGRENNLVDVPIDKQVVVVREDILNNATYLRIRVAEPRIFLRAWTPAVGRAGVKFVPPTIWVPPGATALEAVDRRKQGKAETQRRSYANADARALPLSLLRPSRLPPRKRLRGFNGQACARAQGPRVRTCSLTASMLMPALKDPSSLEMSVSVSSARAHSSGVGPASSIARALSASLMPTAEGENARANQGWRPAWGGQFAAKKTKGAGSHLAAVSSVRAFQFLQSLTPRAHRIH